MVEREEEPKPEDKQAPSPEQPVKEAGEPQHKHEVGPQHVSVRMVDREIAATQALAPAWRPRRHGWRRRLLSASSTAATHSRFSLQSLSHQEPNTIDVLTAKAGWVAEAGLCAHMLQMQLRIASL